MSWLVVGMRRSMVATAGRGRTGSGGREDPRPGEAAEEEVAPVDAHRHPREAEDAAHLPAALAGAGDARPVAQRAGGRVAGELGEDAAVAGAGRVVGVDDVDA